MVDGVNRKNIRMDIATEYGRALARVDGVLKRWVDVAEDMQQLTDKALACVSLVMVPAMREGGFPEMSLVVDGDEQEAAAWRVLEEFKAECGWSELMIKRELGGNLTALQLFHKESSRRLCVNVRRAEV